MGYRVAGRVCGGCRGSGPSGALPGPVQQRRRCPDAPAPPLARCRPPRPEPPLRCLSLAPPSAPPRRPPALRRLPAPPPLRRPVPVGRVRGGRAPSRRRRRGAPPRGGRVIAPMTASAGRHRAGLTPPAPFAAARADGAARARPPRPRASGPPHEVWCATALEVSRLTVTRMAEELGIPRATLEAYRWAPAGCRRRRASAWPSTWPSTPTCSASFAGAQRHRVRPAGPRAGRRRRRPRAARPTPRRGYAALSPNAPGARVRDGGVRTSGGAAARRSGARPYFRPPRVGAARQSAPRRQSAPPARPRATSRAAVRDAPGGAGDRSAGVPTPRRSRAPD
jgi:hypothetical protein